MIKIGNKSYETLIDTSVTTRPLGDLMSCYESLSDVDNIFDHLPVSLGLDLNVTTVNNDIRKKMFH